MKRTLSVETAQQTNKQIKLQGWVNNKRDHGQVTFIDLRDRSGIVQVVGDKSLRKLRSEDVIEVVGDVRLRPEEMINPNLETGTVEVEVKELKVLNKSKTLPFPIDTDGNDIDEELRLKYRYIDLRRQRLQRNIKTRSAYVQAIREYMFEGDFTEIETPLLTKSTPEGSRDFVVPSRLNPGKFFALPQSPQQYKQLLMTAGFERYFQMARCLRDEDPRADRGFEHTQWDMEMSFVNREDVMKMVESTIIFALEKIGYGEKILSKPFPIITYQEAMEKYGEDKFDLRTAEEKATGKLAFAWVIDFPFFEKTADGGWTFSHNPFSQPSEQHLEQHLKSEGVDEIITQQYDLVCNGLEVAGGSIRAHDPEILKATYRIMGYSEAETEASIGHMIRAFELGTPPHGGCAHGFERIIMALFGEDYLREVQSFPQTGSGRTSVMEAPAKLPQEQLDELGLQLSQDNVYDKLIKWLKREGVEYKHYEHESVNTSEEAAELREDETLSQGAKALILKSNKNPVMFVLPGDKRVDFKVLRKLLGFSKLSFMDPKQILDNYDLEIGGVPPFGSLIDLPTYVDAELSKNKMIVFNAGRKDRSVSISHEDYLKLEEPTVLELESNG